MQASTATLAVQNNFRPRPEQMVTSKDKFIIAGVKLRDDLIRNIGFFIVHRLLKNISNNEKTIPIVYEGQRVNIKAIDVSSVDNVDLKEKHKWILSNHLGNQLSYVSDIFVDMLKTSGGDISSIVVTAENLSPDKIGKSLLIKEAAINVLHQFAQNKKHAWIFKIPALWQKQN